jgi:hypothetical protein
MAANQTVNTYGTTYFAPTDRSIAELKGSYLGVTFPLGREKIKGSFFNRESGKELIRGAVKQLIKTERGERIMLPSFGCNLRKYLFQPLDEATFESIKREVLYSFDKYIVGAKVKKLSVIPYGDIGPAGGNSLKITLLVEMTDTDLAVFDVQVVIK